MNTKKNTTNGVTMKNGHVQLAREEYDAYRALEERTAELTTEHAKAVNRARDLTETCNAQAKYMQEGELKIAHLERVCGLQKVFIDLLRGDKVASLQDLSEFWRQWNINTGNATNAGKLKHEEVMKYEPDLFKTWRNWVRDEGKVDRMFGEAGSRMTRDEYEKALPRTPGEMQALAIARLRSENFKLTERTKQLEGEIENFKAAQKANQPPQGKQQ